MTQNGSETFELLSMLYYVLCHADVDASNGVVSPIGVDEGRTRYNTLLRNVRNHLAEQGDSHAMSEVVRR